MTQKKLNKILIVGITIILLTIVFNPTLIAIKTDNQTVQYNAIQTGIRGTDHHTVLGEQGTATWCPHCPSMGYWLGQVQGDFVYVALIADKNGQASSRCSELGLTGYPTTFFDGGYRDVVGHQYNVNNLQNAYDQCQARTVADLSVSLSATLDEENDELEVVTFIDNNQDSSFSGRLRVFVCEKTSRFDDYDGDPYVNGFIGWAPNTAITIGALGSISKSGSLSYPDIEKDNILIIAAVYDSANDYVQQVETATPVSGGDNGGTDFLPPVVKIENPKEGDIVKDTINIEGTAHHPEGDGKLKWTFIKINDGEWEKTDGVNQWSYTWDTTASEDGEYEIQAITSDGTLQSAAHVIHILVNNYANFPPYEPNMPTGPEEGTAGYMYTYTTQTQDPNGNQIRYGWDMNNDDIVDIWTDYHESGEEIQTDISWGEAGTYYLKVKAEDKLGNASEFSQSFTVEITGTNQAPSTPVITGPSKGIPDEAYEFTATSADPEKTDIWYLFDWGDGEDSGWRGPYSSGESLTLSHAWENEDTFEVSVKTKDIHDEDSEWGKVSVSIPHSKTIVEHWIQIIMEHFPLLERIISIFF